MRPTSDSTKSVGDGGFDRAVDSRFASHLFPLFSSHCLILIRQIHDERKPATCRPCVKGNT